jgi:hypothetical protein
VAFRPSSLFYSGGEGLPAQLGALDSPTGGDEPDISQPPLRTLRALIMSLAKTSISLSLWPSYPLQLILSNLPVAVVLGEPPSLLSSSPQQP